ncbi:MAG: tetratricopeptide repeat protein [Saprospiraceae bacterium]|nr:tetratricopeptide repeat protein [Saprospiraceae bacterium]
MISLHLEAQMPEHLVRLNAEADSLMDVRAYPEALEIKKKLVRRVMSLDSFPAEVLRLQIELARISRRVADYPAALRYAREAVQFGEEFLPHDPLLSSAYNSLGIYFYLQSDPEPALEAYEKAYLLRYELFGPQDPRVADVLNNMGICYEQMSDYRKALERYHQAKQIRFDYYGDCHSSVADSYLNMGTCWHKWGDFRMALDFYAKARQIYESDLEQYGADLVLVLNNMGVCYQDRGDYLAAEQLLELTLATNLKLHPPDHPDIATSLNNLGLNFFDLGDYNKALVYFRRALDIRERSLEPGHPWIASLKNHMASCYLKKKDYDRAYGLASEALQMRLDHFGPMNRDVADSYSDLGLYFEKINQYDSAETNYLAALEIYKDQLGSQHPLVADTYQRLGDCFLIQGQEDQAVDYFVESLRIKQKSLGVDHPEVARIFARIAQCKLNDPETGLFLLESNLTGLGSLEHPDDPHSVFSPLVALEILMAKSELLQAWQQQHQDSTRLLQIRAVHDTGLKWMDRALQSFQEPGSKQLLMDRFYLLLEMILENCDAGFAQTGDSEWIERAFAVSERGKSLLLRESVAKVQAASFAGIPDSLRKEEQNLLLDIAALERRIFQAPDSLKKNLDGELFIQKQNQYQLLGQIKETFPEYYELRYGSQAFRLDKLKSYVQQEGLNILEYFQGDRSVYVFLLNADTLWMKRLGSGTQLSSKVKSFREALTSYNPIQDAGKDLPAIYGAMAYDLYNMLIEPLENLMIGNRLLIIPDGSLHYLPFDCLVGQPVGPNSAWRDMSFLLNQYSVGYAYTVDLLLRPVTHYSRSASKMLAVAPDFKAEGDLDPLLYNEEEVNSVSTKWPGTILSGPDATKERFRKEAPNYQVLHLATHASANDTMGSYSYLAFQGNQRGGDSTRLFARELYNMRLPADLVVLSACETGVGEWQRGEGMISLARGFFYSGSKSLLTSLWKLDDRSSSQLMTSFYGYLLKGETKDLALQQAKLDFIRESSSVRAHPFYWASFVPVGLMDPIEVPASNNWLKWVLMGLFSLLLGSVVLFFRRKRPA